MILLLKSTPWKGCWHWNQRRTKPHPPFTFISVKPGRGRVSLLKPCPITKAPCKALSLRSRKAKSKPRSKISGRSQGRQKPPATDNLFLGFERSENLGFDLGVDFCISFENFLGGIATLSELASLIAEPGPTLFNDAFFQGEIEKRSGI